MVDGYYLCSTCGLDLRMLVTGCQCEDNPVQIAERKRKERNAFMSGRKRR